jgi:ABC-type Fe3+-siderophore transport system permease subunit
VVAPIELPVGAITALAGAPVFIYLMRRRVR